MSNPKYQARAAALGKVKSQTEHCCGSLPVPVPKAQHLRTPGCSVSQDNTAMLRTFGKLEPSPSFAANIGGEKSQYPILYSLGDNLLYLEASWSL